MTTRFNSWNYEGEFLNKYPRYAQGTIMNMFCYAVRDGASTPPEVLQDVEYQSRRRVGRNESEYLTDEWLAVLIEDLLTDEAIALASFVLWRESLPAEDRQRLKKAAGGNFATESMAGQAPTEKQLKYLKHLAARKFRPRSFRHHSLLTSL